MSTRSLRHRQAFRWAALGMLAPATLVAAGCTDREAPPPETPAIEVSGAERVTLREEPQAPPPGETAPQGHTWSFDDGDAGTLPAGFTAASGQWALVRVDDAPSGRGVLAQEAERGRPAFNVVLAAETDPRDLDLSVRLRAVSGRIDRGGGLVWRARDGRNYYIARYNPLEDNFRVYKVVDGRRTQLASADVRLDHEAWHTVRVVMHGDRIQCFLDGVRHLDVRDATFGDPGHVGLWTKADARTHFDDLTLRPVAGSLEAEAIGRIVGVRAVTAEDGVVRVTWPRTEVAVTVDGVQFPPPAGLTTWAALSPAPDGALLMGDTVVFEDEVSPAMDAAFAHDLEVTALHNHFFFDQPPVYFMHLGGTGEPERLARGVRAVWDAVRDVRRRRPQPASRFPNRVPAPGPLDAEAIGRILGHPASVSGGVVKVTLGREARMHGVEVGASMGLTTWAAFTGSDAHAAIDGDFAMTAAEVQPVLRALRRAGIHVVALHNHMIGEKPAYFFTHFWGTGPAADLARGFRSALDAQGRAGGSR